MLRAAALILDASQSGKVRLFRRLNENERGLEENPPNAMIFVCLLQLNPPSGDPQLAARIEELASTNTEGELTPAKLAEYVRANTAAAIVRLRIRQMSVRDSRTQ